MKTDADTTAAARARELVAQLLRPPPGKSYWLGKDVDRPSAKEILAAEPVLQVAALRECVDQVGATRDRLKSPVPEHVFLNLHHEEEFPRAAAALVPRLLRRRLTLTDDDLAFLLDRTAHLGIVTTWCIPYVTPLIGLIETRAKEKPLIKGIVQALARLHASLSYIGNAPERKLRDRIDLLCGGPQELPIQPGEAWSDAAIAELRKSPEKLKTAWTTVLEHCAHAEGSEPSAKWTAEAKLVMRELPKGEYKRRVLRWFPLVSKPRTQVIEQFADYQPDPNLMILEPHMQLLKGMAWMCGLSEDEQVARAVANLARSAYRKVPKIGPRAVKVGNACVCALSMMQGLHAVGQLGVLRAAVKFGTAQKMIDKAFTKSAERLGLPRDEIEEMGVPSYGMEKVGLRREVFGEGGEAVTAELRVNGRDVTLSWFRADGKPQKSVPAKVKGEHKEELKELQGAVKDISAMLGAQAERIDSMFLLQKRWPLPAWRERYLDHPLIGTIARRLIWSFKVAGRELVGMWHDGRVVDADDAPLELPEDAQVELWHPIGRPLDDVLTWRAWLDRHGVRQPFKQAHREVYVLTDAERRTGTYSNRFAGHVLRQHQFNALCAARGWKNKLRLLVDDTYPPASRQLPNWGLRAEYWIEGLGDNYGQDTNDSGVFLRLSTDQVRFYRTVAAENTAHAGGGGYESRAAGPGEAGVNEPVPLDRIPALVLSEIMRDVDLFVGVASVGNDPTWQDGGPEGRYQTYWQSYSFGELTETAKTRRAVLETLLPRLTKIRERCSLEERFLIVRGDLRSYKIHLGSGNILMMPNDAYLCIVADRSAGSDGSVFLPFEGDATLSIILSKAFLLAEDTKIKDPTITRQISRA